MNDASGYGGGTGGFGGGFGMHGMGGGGGRAGMGQGGGGGSGQMPTAFSTLSSRAGTPGALGMPGSSSAATGAGAGAGAGPHGGQPLGGPGGVGVATGGGNGGGGGGGGAPREGGGGSIFMQQQHQQQQQQPQSSQQQQGGGQRSMQDGGGGGMSHPAASDLLSGVGNKGGMSSQRVNNPNQLAMDGGGAGPSPFGGIGGGNDLSLHGLGGGGGGGPGNGGGGGLGGGGLGGAPSGHSSLSFDMKEFPALGSGMANLNLGGNDEGYSRQAYRGEPQGFSMQSDDFPALPVASPSATGQTGSSALGGTAFHPSSASEGMGAGALRGAPGQARPMGPGVAGGPTAAAVVAASEGKVKKYGLLGLLGVIRMTDPDLNMLALGSDLTTVGLNLDSAEVLYATFASPWAEEPATPEPQFNLPGCYFLQPPPLKPMNLKNFQLETLFYIFYTMPEDVLQAYSAQELYSREWRFHSVLKLWFKRATAADGNVPPGVQYIYFNHKEWERQFFAGSAQMIQAPNGLLTEEDIRIK